MTTRVIILMVFLEVQVFQAVGQKPRLIVTTDIGQDPDDEQSMVRLLHYANDFEIEGLIANADSNSERESPVVKEYLIHRMIDAYALIAANLKSHDPAYPDAAYLHSVVKRGCAGNGVDIPYSEYLGEGKDTEGSEWIIHIADKADSKPLNISVWGGACDLAQALWKIKMTRSTDDVRAFVKKLRVFFIGKQDSSNDWIMETFPDLWLILALDKGGDNWASGYRGMFLGGDMSLTSRLWLHQYVIGQNPLADLYPENAYTGGEAKNPHMAMKEGDSPAFLYFLPNGLNCPAQPSWGGWGGRYGEDHDHFFTDAADVYFDEQNADTVRLARATVFRWRPDFQHDFATRVSWGMRRYENANHHPIVRVNGISGPAPLWIQGQSGDSIVLDARKSTDPDGDNLVFHWMAYPEAGTANLAAIIDDADKKIATAHLPSAAKGKTMHVILRITDMRAIPLTSYKRIIITVK